MSTSTQYLALILFVIAILHTFSVKLFQHWAKGFREGSVGENLMHLLGEVEVIFGLWSFVFFVGYWWTESLEAAVDYVNTRNFTEPMFVFAVMVVASSKPIIDLASRAVSHIATLIPLDRPTAFYLSCLVLGPLLGSFITEPAAMTVTAIILLNTFYAKKISNAFKYGTLGLLFVNVSIGGTLTHFAAPPVVMVANTWGWNTPFMLSHFGWKAIVAIVVSTVFFLYRFRKEFQSITIPKTNASSSPWIMSFIHLVFLTLIVLNAHHPKLFMSLLLFFLGMAHVTKEYQSPLKIREGLLVGFFLGGLVTLGGVQSWWISGLVNSLSSLGLYLSSVGLTAIFDNAALTYLGSLVPGITEASKYALVSGAVVGGGLTVIANAPNPIGFGILAKKFGNEGINPLLLLKEAALPTLIAGLIFWIL